MCAHALDVVSASAGSFCAQKNADSVWEYACNEFRKLRGQHEQTTFNAAATLSVSLGTANLPKGGDAKLPV